MHDCKHWPLQVHFQAVRSSSAKHQQKGSREKQPDDQTEQPQRYVQTSVPEKQGQQVKKGPTQTVQQEVQTQRFPEPGAMHRLP